MSIYMLQGYVKTMWKVRVNTMTGSVHVAVHPAAVWRGPQPTLPVPCRPSVDAQFIRASGKMATWHPQVASHAKKAIQSQSGSMDGI